jgi:hypothetical protein
MIAVARNLREQIRIFFLSPTKVTSGVKKSKLSHKPVPARVDVVSVGGIKSSQRCSGEINGQDLFMSKPYVNE